MASKKVESAFREVYRNEPAIVKHTRQKFGAKRAAAQKKAIALDKARRAGAKIQRRPHGSGVFTDPEIQKGYRTL